MEYKYGSNWMVMKKIIFIFIMIIVYSFRIIMEKFDGIRGYWDGKLLFTKEGKYKSFPI